MIMPLNSHHSEPGIQANRQLKEWTDNLTQERQARYDLAGKHRQESSRFSLEDMTIEQQALVAARHLLERTMLKQQQSTTRQALQDRHSHETKE